MRQKPTTPRRHAIHSRACIIPNGIRGRAHLAIYHPRTRTLTYSGPATGSGWQIACRLAKLLHATPRSVSVPDQVDALDRAMLYAEDPSRVLYAGLTQEQLELFWASVYEHRVNAARTAS